MSPNGKLLVYFAYKTGNWEGKHGGAGYGHIYTVICRPPYITALALWPTGDTYGGGGLFIDDCTLRLAHSVGRTFHPYVGDTKIFMSPISPPHPNHPPKGLKIETHLYAYDPQLHFKDRETKISNASWSGIDHFGRNIFTRDGKLYRVTEIKEHKLLVDFNKDQVKNIKSPSWASEWPV